MKNHVMTQIDSNVMEDVCCDEIIKCNNVKMDFHPSGLVVVIGDMKGEKEQIKTVLGICSDLLSQIENPINRLKEVGTTEERFAKDDLLIDRELKSHIKKIIKDITRLNSSSTMRDDMKEFYGFDKIELGIL